MNKYLGMPLSFLRTYFENNKSEIKQSFLIDGPIFTALGIVVEASLIHVNYAEFTGLDYLGHLKLSLYDIPQMYAALSVGYASYAISNKRRKLEKELELLENDENIIDVEYEVIPSS